LCGLVNKHKENCKMCDQIILQQVLQ